MNREVFLVNRDDTGREIITFTDTGKSYFIEYIGSGYSNWGDLNPATGQIEGSYGQKYKGSINKEESLITEENNFKNISEGKGSPYDKIIEMHNNWKNNK